MEAAATAAAAAEGLRDRKTICGAVSTPSPRTAGGAAAAAAFRGAAMRAGGEGNRGSRARALVSARGARGTESDGDADAVTDDANGDPLAGVSGVRGRRGGAGMVTAAAPAAEPEGRGGVGCWGLGCNFGEARGVRYTIQSNNRLKVTQKVGAGQLVRGRVRERATHLVGVAA